MLCYIPRNMPSPKQFMIGTGLLGGLLGSAFCWHAWLAGAGDPALGGDPAAYARATGVLMTPAGVVPAAAFSDGPGRIPVAEALALVGGTEAAAVERLGKPDRILGAGGAHPIDLWWNAVVPERPDRAQPPAFHLRLDLSAGGGTTVVRIACLGACLAETAVAPR